MNHPHSPWQKLTALARQAPDDRSAAAPYGFATRVVARVAAQPALSPWAVFERFALRGLMIAAAFGVAAIAFNYSTLTTEPSDDAAAIDPVAELLELS
jgi:hypothetical protein